MPDTEFKLEYLKPSQWKDWDGFLKNSIQGTIFQSSAYIESIADAFQRSVKILTVYGRNRIVAGVVLFPNRKFGVNFNSLPYYAPYNGILVDQFTETSFYFKKNRLQQKVIHLLNHHLRENFAFCGLHQSSHPIDLRKLIATGWTFTPHYTIILPLQKNLLEITAKDQRRRLRNFENEKYNFFEMDDMKLFYQRVGESYRQHDMEPPIAEEQFTVFSRQLLEKKLARCYGLQYDGQLLTGLLVVEDFPNVYALFSGSQKNPEASGAELYLIWKVAAEYQKHNFTRFDLLGAMVPSIAKIKIELGGELERSDQLFHYKNTIFRLLFDAAMKLKSSRRKL